MTGAEIKKIYPKLRDAENHFVVIYKKDLCTIGTNLTIDQAYEVISYLLNFIDKVDEKRI
jgi:2-keto-4-pentenoate hydratase